MDKSKMWLNPELIGTAHSCTKRRAAACVSPSGRASWKISESSIGNEFNKGSFFNAPFLWIFVKMRLNPLLIFVKQRYLLIVFLSNLCYNVTMEVAEC